jgi:protein-tyrosine-phosphatase
MAETFLRELSAGAIVAMSAGSEGAGEIDPMAAQVMEEIGMPIKGSPKKLNAEMVVAADAVITMGCGVDAASCPANWFETEDWGIDDPKGSGIDAFRSARDRIRKKVENLIERIHDG